ncbi:DMT family transporter [Exiguobacterium oxidotolerans]|uniref:Putative permease n=1 Tax=Exiguobacterium oxidotolerans TaxID=223958 RepID=A0A653IHT9_9BACL|nr:multidrug resistance efflux transporter family protein [Exiguobacterium oxidotolerans]VWX38720.1 putative permease [Exiguobacterium oxidotolerans]
MRPILIGILSAMFFAVTFILNQSMQGSGGHWIYSAALRFYLMLPFLILIVGYRRRLGRVWSALRTAPRFWLTYGTIGFGIFYSGICFAADYAPGWLIAGTWQVTILAGPLLAPLFKQTIPWASLRYSLLIVMGVLLMQLSVAGSVSVTTLLLGVVPVILAAIAYPLGNRKMMERYGDDLGVFDRILGMTLASLPFWLILSGFAYVQVGLPSATQVGQSGLVALFSGVIATSLFFYATTLVRTEPIRLAAVEATQSFEIVFTVLGELVFLHAVFPSGLALFGIIIVMLGMTLHSFRQGSQKVMPD